jgi:hypothetical protein
LNISLRKRVAFCFIIANSVILVLTFFVFHHLNSLNQDIDNMMERSNQATLFMDEIRISAVSILKQQRILITAKDKAEPAEKMINLCDGLLSQLQNLKSLFTSPEIKPAIAEMEGYVNSLKILLSKAGYFRGEGLKPLIDLSDKILDSFTDFQDIQYRQSEGRDEKMKEIINQTKRNMMITLIIGFLGTIILGLIVPGKIALPFKKINDAIRELQDCNFDVSIFYNQDDEIGEIAREMNKMITSMKKFEELRYDRVNVELRKFDALANLVKKPVLVANSEGKLIYMNNQLYDILQVQSDDIISQSMNETIFPRSMIEAYEKAIKRRSKIENAEIVIMSKKRVADVDQQENHMNGNHGTLEALNSFEAQISREAAQGNELLSQKKNLQPILNKEENRDIDDETDEKVEIAFQGYANVIPIRGKDSSLDYYLMVMSTEVFQ